MPDETVTPCVGEIDMKTKNREACKHTGCVRTGKRVRKHALEAQEG